MSRPYQRWVELVGFGDRVGVVEVLDIREYAYYDLCPRCGFPYEADRSVWATGFCPDCVGPGL